MDTSPRSSGTSVPEIPNQHHAPSAPSRFHGANPAEASHKPAPAPTRSELLRAALEYAKKGIPVFPLKPSGKEPLTRRGFKDATTNPQQIMAWWNAHPLANVGVPTGMRSGWLVIDVDHTAGLDALEEEHGRLTDTRTHATGSGGMHMIFAYPGEASHEVRNSAGTLAENVDVRGEGGYVVVPPSRTTRHYEVLDNLPLADPPAWLLEALTAPKKASSKPQGSRLAVVDSGPIPKHRRNDALASILGRAHDGTRDLPALIGYGLAVRDEFMEEPGSFPDREVEKTARSIHKRPPCRPAAARAPEEVQRKLAAIEEALGAMAWPGHTSNRLSLLKTYILLARKHGELREDGVAISVSNSQAALHNGCSDRSVRRNNAKLAGMGLIRTDNGGRTPTESGTVVMLAPRPAGSPYATAAPGCVLTHIHRGRVVGEGAENPAEAGGRGLGHIRAASPSGNSSGSPWSATRARHGKPLYDSAERVGFLSRMGKRAEFAVDVLEGAGSRLRPQELAGAMGITKVRSMSRNGGWLSKLLDAGVVERDGEGYLALTAAWLDAWDRRRVEDEEEVDRERDRERYRRLSKAWAERVAERAEDLRRERLESMVLECFDVASLDSETGEIVAERRTVPVDASGSAERGVPHYHRTTTTLPLTGSEARIPVRVRPGDNTVAPGPDAPVRETSELAAALAVWLERNPGDHPDLHPPEDLAARVSWLASSLWAHDLVRGPRPDPLDVAHALGELARIGAEEAA